MNAKITFPELVALVAEATNTTTRMSELFLKELFATISQSLIKGEDVTIKNLGTFSVGQVAARRSTHVGTGEAIDIPAHNRLIFTPDSFLAETVNQPFAAFETIILSDDVTEEMLHRIDQESEATPIAPPAFTGQEDKALAPQDDAPEESQDVEPTDTEPQLMQDETSAPAQQALDVQTTSLLSEPQPAAAVAHETPAIDEPASIDEDQPIVRWRRRKDPSSPHSFWRGIAIGCLAGIAVMSLIWGIVFRTSGDRKVVEADTISEIEWQKDSLAAVEQDASQQAISQQNSVKSPVVTDTCTSTLFLSRMAQKHYGRPEFWIYIYEENKDLISDPNNPKPGTVVVIPPAEKYGIDANDKNSIRRANTRTYEVLSKMQR